MFIYKTHCCHFCAAVVLPASKDILRQYSPFVSHSSLSKFLFLCADFLFSTIFFSFSVQEEFAELSLEDRLRIVSEVSRQIELVATPRRQIIEMLRAARQVTVDQE